MATQRPGFARADTDNFSNIDNNRSQPSSSSKEYELKSVDPKDGSYIDVQEGETEPPPAFGEDSGEDFAKANIPVESANDLVTQIIHLEDDPTEQPLTFRTWFLGSCFSTNCTYRTNFV